MNCDVGLGVGDETTLVRNGKEAGVLEVLIGLPVKPDGASRKAS